MVRGGGRRNLIYAATGRRKQYVLGLVEASLVWWRWRREDGSGLMRLTPPGRHSPNSATRRRASSCPGHERSPRPDECVRSTIVAVADQTGQLCHHMRRPGGQRHRPISASVRSTLAQRRDKLARGRRAARGRPAITPTHPAMMSLAREPHHQGRRVHKSHSSYEGRQGREQAKRGEHGWTPLPPRPASPRSRRRAVVGERMATGRWLCVI